MIRCRNRKQSFWSETLVFNKRLVLSGYHHLLCILFKANSPIVRNGHVPTPRIGVEIVEKFSLPTTRMSSSRNSASFLPIQNGMTPVFFRLCSAGRRECRQRDIRAGAPTMSHDRAPKSCRALPQSARAVFALDARVRDYQAHAPETILAETRRSRGLFSAPWRWLHPFLKQTSGRRWTESLSAWGIVCPIRLHAFVAIVEDDIHRIAVTKKDRG